MPELTTFDIHKLADIDVQEKEIGGLGIVRFGRLTMKDLADVKRIDDEIEQSYVLLHRMLVKANPGLTVEEIGKWEPSVFAQIFQAVVNISDFREPK